MTNSEIIFDARCKLLELGEIGTTGRAVVFNGKEVAEPEEIHTFSEWKRQGFIVRKGEHAIAKFPIWKYKAGKRKEAEGDEEKAEAKGFCFKKMAFFFKASQVDRLEETK